MDYDIAIHHNADAQAWAKLFIETTKDMDREVFRDEGYMIVWFANAMMAMYDSMDPQKAANEIVRLQGILRLITELSPFKLWPGHASLKFFAEMSIEQEISFCSARLIEITTLAHEALKEKENEIF